MEPSSSERRRSPWPHRLSVALALVTFPLIWVGGLVTTYDAGMAVPDWPGTYGYNLLLYPWQSWLAAPWDLFIEHGHRLLGAAAGLLVITLVAIVLIADRRPWLVRAAFGALALVILQGVLGGARVLFDERLVAMIHGCVGPLFFAYLAALVVTTSRWWDVCRVGFADQLPGPTSAVGGAHPTARFARGTCTTVVLAYVQLVLGAIIRHMPLASSVGLFRAALLLHLIMAAALTTQALFLAGRVMHFPKTTRGAAWSVHALAGLVAVQLLLGAGTYVAKYSWPAWLGDYQFAAAHIVQEKSLVQSLITTAHAANGSLVLFVATIAAVRGVGQVCGIGEGFLSGRQPTADDGGPALAARACPTLSTGRAA